jgi:phosphoribosylformylglycinamidine synthase subunit PurL
LNFGNPYNKEVYWQFVHAIKGMGKACEKFQTPVTGGNVSFYNQSSDEGPVFPTPTIGMLGILENKQDRMTLDFKKEGDLIFLIGESKNDIASSEYLYSYHHIEKSPAPYFDLDAEYTMQQVISRLIKEGLIQSAHDVSDGGLYVTLAESAMPRSLGFDIITDDDIRKDAFLFGESQSRVVVSVAEKNIDRFVDYLTETDVDFINLGVVTASQFLVDDESFGSSAEAKQLYDNALGEMMKG